MRISAARGLTDVKFYIVASPNFGKLAIPFDDSAQARQFICLSIPLIGRNNYSHRL